MPIARVNEDRLLYLLNLITTTDGGGREELGLASGWPKSE